MAHDTVGIMRRAKTIIHVNMHVIKKNAKTGSNDPVLTVKRGKTNRYAHRVFIDGPSEVIYSPDKPLSCGARCWVETTSEVFIEEEAEGGRPPGDRTLSPGL